MLSWRTQAGVFPAMFSKKSTVAALPSIAACNAAIPYCAKYKLRTLEFSIIVSSHQAGTSAVDITEVLTARQATTDPTRRRNLGNKVLGVLDLLLQAGHERNELVVKEGLCDCVAGLAHAAHLCVLENRLHLRITTAAAHIRNGEEGASLGAGVATLDVLSRLVAEHAVGVDVVVILAKAVTGLHHKALHSERINRASIRNQLCRGVEPGADGLLCLLLNSAEIVPHICQAIDVHSHL